MSTKKELEAEIEDLREQLRVTQSYYELACQDRDDTCETAAKLEHRHILVKVKRDGELLDAVVIPPDGRTSVSIISSLNDVLDDSYADLYTEPIT